MTAPFPQPPRGGGSPVNEGERPDLLTLGRTASSELPGPLPADYADALTAARATTPPLDIQALRDRAATLDPRDEAANTTSRSGGSRWALWLGAPLAFAAAALFALQAPVDDGIRTKGHAPVDVGAGCADCAPGVLKGWVMQGQDVSPIDAETVVSPGDRVRLAVPDTGRSSVVVFNVDATGQQQVFWPASASEPPVPLAAEGPTLLDDSVQLDDAPGPEAFVAIFDTPDVATAEAEVARAWSGGGLAALRALADTRDDVALMVLPKVDEAR